MVERQPSKLHTRVRFPSLAPIERHFGYKDFRPGREVSGVAFSLFRGGFRGVRVGCMGPWSGSQLGRIVSSERPPGGLVGQLRQEASKNMA